MIFRRAADLKAGDHIVIEERPYGVIYIRGIGNNLLIGLNYFRYSEIAVSMDDYFEIPIQALASKAVDLQRKPND